MLFDDIQTQEQQQLSIDELTSPITNQLFEFCDPDLFQEKLQNSEVTSGSNCYYEENWYTNNLCASPEDEIVGKMNKYAGKYYIRRSSKENETNMGMSMPIIYDTKTKEKDIDFSPSTHPNPQCHISQYNGPSYPASNPAVIFDEDCLTYGPLAAMPTTYMPATATATAIGMNDATLSFLQAHELDCEGEKGGMYCQDTIFNRADLQVDFNQAFSSESKLSSAVTDMDDSCFNRIIKLSPQERKEKIHRYMKKRNHRNFTKKIKYACRKTLADSRPRVRGRFAKNDNFGNPRKLSYHEEDDDDEVVLKGEEGMIDSSDIFAYLSGADSFKSDNYHIQSWV